MNEMLNPNMDSILTSIKKLLGLPESATEFDGDIIVYINSEINVLRQLGVGAIDGYRVTSAEQTWADYIGDEPRLDLIKDAIYLRVKILFDTPQSGIVLECLKEQLKEAEWRLSTEEDPVDPFSE